MKCRVVEQRLNELLDERQPWSADPCLAAHLKRCAECRRLAVGYEWISCAAAQPGQTPPVSPTFAERTIARLRPTIRVSQKEIRPALVNPGRRLRWATYWLAAAAALVFAAWPWFVGRDPAPSAIAPTSVVHRIAVAQGDRPLARSMLVGGSQLSHERLWQVTGRNLAEIPVRFRRVTHLYAGEGIGGTLRPVADTLSDTLEAVSRLLPPEPARTEAPGGGTGHWSPSSQRHVA